MPFHLLHAFPPTSRPVAHQTHVRREAGLRINALVVALPGDDQIYDVQWPVCAIEPLQRLVAGQKTADI
jgi:hypothetical protein